MLNHNFAFLFPGQGSQKLGMLQNLIETDGDLINQNFTIASECLGYDLLEIATTDAHQRINLTEFTQPLLLATSYCIWQLFNNQCAHKPSQLAGHSLGEWSALVASGVVTFSDAIKIVSKRGQFMQSACQPGKGTMFAIVGLADTIVEDCCGQAASAGYVEVANYNSPGQVVISGETQAVEAAVALCKDNRAKIAVQLPVSAPFHSALMQQAAEQMQQLLQGITFHSPQIPIIHNANLAVTEDPIQIKQNMVDQICSPVPWVKTIQMLTAKGINHYFECGPGNVLSGLNKRIDRSVTTQTMQNSADITAAIQTINAL